MFTRALKSSGKKLNISVVFFTQSFFAFRIHPLNRLPNSRPKVIAEIQNSIK